MVFSIDDKIKILLLEAYMAHQLDSFKLTISPKHPYLVVRDNILFFREWPRMEVGMQFLLRWRGIKEDPTREWLMTYLQAFDAYIHLDVDFVGLEVVEFCLPNFD